jgi:hypothetical protein
MLLLPRFRTYIWPAIQVTTFTIGSFPYRKSIKALNYKNIGCYAAIFEWNNMLITNLKGPLQDGELLA